MKKTSARVEASVIDQLDGQLTGWIREVLDPISVSLSAPSNDSSEGINIYLMEIVRKPSARSGSEKPPLKATLRYLVTSNGQDITDAHRRLWELIVHAVQKAETSDWSVELDPIPPEAWRAFGIAPRPSFILGIPVQHEWEQRKLPIVTKAPEVGTSVTCSLGGRVVGPEDVPFVGATVELPSLGLSTLTGAAGRFHFALVPGGEHFPTELVVSAKGRGQRVSLNREHDRQSILIRAKFDE